VYNDIRFIVNDIYLNSMVLITVLHTLLNMPDDSNIVIEFLHVDIVDFFMTLLRANGTLFC